MTQPIPDRVSADRDSPHYLADCHLLRIWVDGIELHDVVEYCISESWYSAYANNPDGSFKTEAGKYVTELRDAATLRVEWKTQ